MEIMAPSAQAQVQNGQIQGVVTSDADGKPLIGVTVTISGPALQEDQIEVTGRDGRYLITQLPSGDDYVVRFYLGDAIVERPGVRVGQNKTLTISVAMPMKKLSKEVKVIKERAPNVDTATANSGLEINEDVIRNTAMRGRTFESVLALAPGTVDPPRGQGGDIGVSISGSSGNENNFIIDGLNTSDPNSGILSTELHQYFIKELNVITGGYQAEYGRATGGVVSIVTKTGGNEFHGSVFGSVQPFQLTSNTVGRLGEALALRRRPDALTYDIGFDLGGPILKNRIWFYLGFAPTTQVSRNEVLVRRRVFDPTTGSAKLLDSYECPSYLASSVYCRAARVSALETEDLSTYTQNADGIKRLYNGIAKLQFNLNADHNITLGYIAAPSTFEGYSTLDPPLYSTLQDFHLQEINQVHDVMGRYVGKLLDHRLQLDAMYGFHYQNQDQHPDNFDKPIYVYHADPKDPYSLADFQPLSDCRRTANGFNPCPVSEYRRNGFGNYENLIVQRHQLLVAATAYLSGLGTHAIKLGFDFEHLDQNHTRQYSGTDIDPNDPTSGHRFYQTSDNGSQFQNFAEYFTGSNEPNEDCPFIVGGVKRCNRFRAHTFTNNYALYLRDSWNVSKLRGLVLNVGLRYEIQEIFGVDASRQIFIYDNVAPRVGAVWDFTQKGLSKLYVNFARFYESVPLTINDRQFSGEGLITGLKTSDCPRQALQPGGRLLPYAGTEPGAPCTLVHSNDDMNAGRYGQVMPGLKGQYVDEVVAGISYDVGWDVVLGLGYIYRTLGNIIEDVSIDGGHSYLIANPGREPDPKVLAELSDKAAAGDADAAANLQIYRSLASVFPRAQRNYHALVLSVQKRLSNRVSILANYTFSRTIGNYPGSFDATSNENLPNFSSNYDITNLLVNKNGPLPTDRPHNFKMLVTYDQPLPRGGHLQVGLTLSAFSGRPVNVLGAHPVYGPSYVFILPRGSGGRTPTVTQFDLHLGFEQPLGKRAQLSLFTDVINLLNQREVTNVDDDYTYSSVVPIANGHPGDLLHLRTMGGGLPVINSNYGQPTGYQSPLYMRFGARVAF